MTISVSGVTQYSSDEITFIPIELWKKEYIHYLILMKVLSILSILQYQHYDIIYITILLVNNKNMMDKMLQKFSFNKKVLRKKF